VGHIPPHNDGTTWGQPDLLIRLFWAPSRVSCPTTPFCVTVERRGTAITYNAQLEVPPPFLRGCRRQDTALLQGHYLERAKVHRLGHSDASVVLNQHVLCIAADEHGDAVAAGQRKRKRDTQSHTAYNESCLRVLTYAPTESATIHSRAAREVIPTLDGAGTTPRRSGVDDPAP
jgi:hypothetical protein